MHRKALALLTAGLVATGAHHHATKPLSHHARSLRLGVVKLAYHPHRTRK